MDSSLLYSHPEEAVYFIPLSPLVLIWSTLEQWNAETTLDLTSSFEPETTKLVI